MSANFSRHIAVLSQIRQFAIKLSQEQSWVQEELRIAGSAGAFPRGDVAKVGVHPGQDARCHI